uniref:Uncharacterized protein n=1 Tax=Globodera rostochiensis TaxID=31243 RepID=A0A914H5V3_GLORO
MMNVRIKNHEHAHWTRPTSKQRDEHFSSSRRECRNWKTYGDGIFYQGDLRMREQKPPYGRLYGLGFGTIQPKLFVLRNEDHSANV